MRLLSFDTETYLIQTTEKAPKPVCCSWFDGQSAWLTHPGDVSTSAAFADPSNLYIGQNIAYDLVLMMRWHPDLIPDIMRALDEGRVFDTAMRERMLHLAQHGGRGFNMYPSLADLTLKYLKLDISGDKHGDDIWRLKYGTLDGVPFRDWPEAARKYALDDAIHTYQVFQAQGGLSGMQPTEQMQVQSAVVLQGIGVWGFAVNQNKRAVIKDTLEAKAKALHVEIDKFGWTGEGSQTKLMKLVSEAWNYKHLLHLQARCNATGIYIDPAQVQQSLGTAMLRKALEESAGTGIPLPGINFPPTVPVKEWCKETLKSIPEIPMTKKGPSIAGEVLEQLGDVIPQFATYTELRHIEKMLENYIVPYANDTVHPSFVPLVSTGRTGARTPNVQNVPRKDKDRPDEAFRTMFMARKGRVLGTVDYSQLELCTLAVTIRTMFPNVVCTLGDAIDSGKDVHCITGGLISGMSYEQMIAGKEAKDETVLKFRQGAKACIAKGSLVITDQGAKPIEEVTLEDRVWDGKQWVTHGGVVPQGRRMVCVENRHLALTLDHKVFVSFRKAVEYGKLTEDERNAAYAYNSYGWNIQLPDDYTVFCDGMGIVQTERYFVEETYDIINAGPKHRFHCGGLLVSNCNFGLPGGLGGGAFVGYAKNNYNVQLSLNQAWKYINSWKRAWPEVPNHYLRYSADMVDNSPNGTFTSYTTTGRPKAMCIYTEGSNYPFQGLAADGAKAALWAIWRECILGWYWSTHVGVAVGYGFDYGDSPLSHSRLVNFVHDEIVAEHPEGDAGKAALKRQEALMVSEMTRICQNKIKISVEGKLSDAWEH